MKCGSWDTVTSSCTASRFSFAKSCFPGLWIDSGSPSRAIKGRVEPFFWLCLVGRSGWAWLSPSSEEGSKSQHLSPGPELCQILPAPCEHQICAGLWELILSLWRSLGFVFQPNTPVEITGICAGVWEPTLPFGGPRALCLPAKPSFWRPLGFLFPEVTELCVFQPNLPLCAATRLKCWYSSLLSCHGGEDVNKL